MSFVERVHRVSILAVATSLIFAGVRPLCLRAQQDLAQQDGAQREEGGQRSRGAARDLPATEPTALALPLAEDRGGAALEQALKRLGTTASLMMIVAHPDDEDGALLTYLSRGLGVRATLFTLTRGEGGQNAMSADTDDALGIIRTNELLKAGEFYGAKQLWGTEADFGFSKTQEESFARWGHDRVLYDAVLAVRRERPQIIVSTFVGGITDGHGQHQVSGEIAQEVFKAAADPNVFPEQLKEGLQPWQPLAVYSMVPFAPVTEKGMFDYATGKWAPAKFHNYVTGEWISGVPSSDVTIPVGTHDSTLGRSYVQIAREGWGEQKSQNGGANPALSGPSSTSYHLWAVAPAAKTAARENTSDDDLYHNSKVRIDTSIAGLAGLAPRQDARVADARAGGDRRIAQAARIRVPVQTGCSRCAQSRGDLSTDAGSQGKSRRQRTRARRQKRACCLNSTRRLGNSKPHWRNFSGWTLLPIERMRSSAQTGGFRGSSADETPRSVSAGEQFKVHVHTSSAASDARLVKTWFESQTSEPWVQGEAISTAGKGQVSDAIFNLKVPDNAESTKPFFTRPSIEQPYYDISNPAWRERSFAPWPLAAWAEFSFEGVPIRLGRVVQTLQRVTGPGGIYEPLVVTPAIGVRVEPEARILPLDGSALPVRVTVHTQSAADGTVELKLPAGWRAEPAEAKFHRTSAGDTEPILFSVTPAATESGGFSVQAVAHSNGRTYETGWRSLGYAGLRPYNQYQACGAAHPQSGCEAGAGIAHRLCDGYRRSGAGRYRGFRRDAALTRRRGSCERPTYPLGT